MTIVASGGLDLSHSNPAAAADNWSFSGVISAPVRGETIIKIQGDLTAPSGTPAKSGDYANPGYFMVENFCLIRQGTADPDPGQVFNSADRRCKKWYFPMLSSGYYGQAPGAAQYIELDTYAADGPGIYDMKIYTEDRESTQAVQGIGPISVVAETSRTPVITASAASVVVGKSVTLTALYSITWSDGQTTQVPPNRNQSTTLQARRVGDIAWTTVSREQTHTGKVTDSMEVRYLIEQQPSVPTLIAGIYPTKEQRFTSVTAGSQRIYSGTPVSLRAAMETLFTDDQWRPTPAQTVQLQFSVNGRTDWTTVGNAWVRGGEALKNLTPTKSGSWRFLTGDTQSTTAFIRVLQR